MDILDYVQNVEKGISLKRGVDSVEGRCAKRLGRKRVVLGTRCCFFDGSFLDIRLTVDTSKCYPEYELYSYQYVDSNGEQAFRYDNYHDHPEVGVSQEHKHVGPDNGGHVEDCRRPSHRNIFDEILRIILSDSH